MPQSFNPSIFKDAKDLEEAKDNAETFNHLTNLLISFGHAVSWPYGTVVNHPANPSIPQFFNL